MRYIGNANLTLSDDITHLSKEFKICANSHDSIEQRKDTVGVEVKSENQQEVKKYHKQKNILDRKY